MASGLGTSVSASFVLDGFCNPLSALKLTLEFNAVTVDNGILTLSGPVGSTSGLTWPDPLCTSAY